jgi:hypothetical protein
MAFQGTQPVLVAAPALLIVLRGGGWGISLRSGLASAILVSDPRIVRYSLPTGVIICRVELGFLLGATAEPGQGKRRQDNREHIGLDDHPHLLTQRDHPLVSNPHFAHFAIKVAVVSKAYPILHGA